MPDSRSPDWLATARAKGLVDAETAAPVRRKYGNEPTTIDGRRFDSKAEARRYGELVLLQRAGKIRDLECQPEFPLVVNGEQVACYVGDFCYVDVSTGTVVVEDVKSAPTRKNRAYRLKCKMVKAQYGIEIKEIA